MNGTAECWVLSDGKPGMRNQCVGLAEALGVDFVVKTVRPRLPWRILAPQLWLAPLSAPGVGGDGFRPPWPELLIATGRQTVALALAIKRASAGRTFTVQIQNPAFALSRFDVVVAPRHDEISGANVIVTEGALHRVTGERLAREAARFRPLLADLPRPLVAVLVGGSNRQYRFTRDAAERLADGLQSLEWVKEGRLDLVEEYCRKDVEILRDLYLYGRRVGHVCYQDREGRKVKLPVDW